MGLQASRIRELLFERENSFQDVIQTVRLDDGEILFHRGDPGDAFYLIESGHVRIFTLDEGERELTLNTLSPGESFGELSLLDDRPRSAGAAAVGKTVLRRLRRDDFLSKVHQSPTLTDTIIRLLSQRTRHMTDYIERLGHWARLVAEGKYDQAMKNIEENDSESDRALSAVADAVHSMVRAVREREERLRRKVSQLQIKIDDDKRKQHVEEITETDYFQRLSEQAKKLRDQT